MDKKTIFGLDDILQILPHRPPFLFVDRVIKFTPGKVIIAERKIGNDEPWLRGHFPQKPIMPGVLVLDALAQTSGLLLGFSSKIENVTGIPLNKIFYLASSNMKFISAAHPEETLELIAETDNQFGRLYSYSVEALSGRKTIAKGTLMLAYADSK